MANKYAEKFNRRMPVYRKYPDIFAKEICNFDCDEWQTEGLRDLAGSPRVSIKSGQGVGKTGIEAIAVLWFLSCFKNSRVVCTAPTRQQLNDVLWSEISKWLNRSPILPYMLRWTKTYVYVDRFSERWYAVAKTASKPENMQGYHEDHMLFVVDEASGIEDEIMETILGTLSGENNKLFMCGNPTKTSGTFYDSHTKDRALYKCHTVSSMNSKRTNKDNIASLERKYGAESNVVRVRVDGEFPLQEDDVFIPLSLIEQSINTDYDDKKEVVSIDIGCDVARFGDDKTCIGYKVNEKVEFYSKIQGQDLMRTAGRIIQLGEQLREKHKFKGRIPIKVDDGGLGGGITDRLNEIKRSNPEKYWWFEVVKVLFGKAIKHKNYADTTTYMMAVVKSLLSPYNENGEPQPIKLILPNDEDLVGQLSVRKYDITDDSRIKVESKKSMKGRGLSSPDEADCLCLLCLPVKMKRLMSKGE